MGGRAWALALVIGGIAGASNGAAAHDLAPVELRCEYAVDPLGVGETAPRLSWTLESSRRGAHQTAYRILVASSPERLAHDEGDRWDSGRVASSATAHIAYAGALLASRDRCFWKVRSWNRDGDAGPWSAPAQWEMGLLAPDDWSAKWIDAAPAPARIEVERAVYASIDGAVRKDVTERVRAMVEAGAPVRATNDALGGDPAVNVPKRLEVEYRCDGTTLRTVLAENAVGPLPGARWPYLRTSFELDRPIARARLYATALGVYELSLNGARVGDAHLAPGWTDYRERVRTRTYDVTDRLAPGTNVLGALVGPGWFAGRAGLFHARAFYGRSPALLAQLEVTYADGTVERIVTDGSWRRHDGPILAADLMDGEIHDATREIDGWCTAPADDTGWSPVAVRAESRTLEAPPDAPVRVLEELPARSVTEPAPGRWTFDLGQNMVGVVRLAVRAPRGTVLTIRHGEILEPDGTLYTANLRGAAATDVYVCRGGGVETWTPRFTFHGFRYVEVTGLPAPPSTDAVTGIVLGSDLPVTGAFACSDERLNRLASNIDWGLRGNFLSIPTDCPQRDERMGWTGDAQAFAPTAAYLRRLAPFMTKWMRDVRDAQRDDGAHADVAPVMTGLNYGTPAWGDAGTIVPWTVYAMEGDERILERNVDSMARWVDWCRRHATDGIRDHDRGNDYGDWLSIDADTPKDLIGTAYFAHSADLLARTYAALGRDAEARRARALFEDVRAAFIARYVGPDGRVAGDTQTAMVLALRFGLVPEDLRDAVADRLVADLEARGWRLTTGFVGVSHLLPALSEAGRVDAAYRLLMQDELPSWLFPVKHGATTIWERWNGWTPEQGAHRVISMNSFNHYALGSCGAWLFGGVGGIRPTAPGFATFAVEPLVGGGLTWADVTYRSVRGAIESRWRRDGARFALDVVVPANTTATIVVPRRDGTAVRESGGALDDTEGLEIVERRPDAIVLRAGSGRYAFESDLP